MSSSDECPSRGPADSYTPQLIYYPDDDRLEFVTADGAFVARHLGDGCAVLLDMDSREPVGLYIEAAKARLPSLIGTPVFAAANPSGETAWTCAARHQGTAGGNAPSDCDWPICGCDPYADKVIAALQESAALATGSARHG